MEQQSAPGLDDLVAHIMATSGLASNAVRRIVDDVLAYHDETVEVFVARRHRELAGAGWKNADIYERLAREVAGRVFPGPNCSVRQIRRMIYG